MKKITEKQLETLLLVKAMADSVGSMERWTCLNDVVDEVFMNGVVDRDDFLHGIIELTQLELVASDIKEAEDMEFLDATGYDIAGLTDEGEKYLEKARSSAEFKERMKNLIKKLDEACSKASESGIVKLISVLRGGC